MTRVLVRASSAIAQAGLEQILAGEPDLQVVYGGMADPAGRKTPRSEIRDDDPPDVIVAEVADADEESLWSDALDLSGPATALLLLVEDPASLLPTDALRTGAKGILPRRVSREVLLAAVRAAAAGLVVLHSDILSAALPGRPPVTNRPASLVEPLTFREKEVLAILAEGGSNKDIATRLAISEHTAKFHVSSIMSKLGATSRTEAVTLAIRQGLIMV